jgi:hypothetical protein
VKVDGFKERLQAVNAVRSIDHPRFVMAILVSSFYVAHPYAKTVPI